MSEKALQVPPTNESQSYHLENGPRINQQLVSLFDLAGFNWTDRPVVKHKPNLLEDLGHDDEYGWRLVYKTSIGGYSYHLDFAKKMPGDTTTYHEISLSKPGPWEPNQDRIHVIYSEHVTEPRGIYSRGEGSRYVHMPIGSNGVERVSIHNRDGDWNEQPTPEDLAKFEADFTELMSAVEAHKSTNLPVES